MEDNKTKRDCETCKHYVVVENRHDRETTKSCECWECNYERGMTESEAIKALRLGDGIEISGKSTRVAEFVQALDMAIKALEKQIPKKPMTSYDERVKENWCSCGVCCFGFGWKRAVRYKYKYCPDCGQKIDWESDEE